MGQGFSLRIMEDSVELYDGTFDGPLEIGRQDKGEQAPFSLNSFENRTRLVVASLYETTIARHQLLITPNEEGDVELHNLSTQVTVIIEPRQQLPPSGAIVMTLPATIRCGKKRIHLNSCNSDPNAEFDTGMELRSLAEATIGPGRFGAAAGASVQNTMIALGHGDSEPLIRTIQAMIDVFHNAITPADFFSRAAGAIVELVGLDSGRVLIWEAGAWKEEVLRTAPGIDTSTFRPSSSRVLAEVQKQKRTFWQLGSPRSATESLVNIQSVIATPLLNEASEVFGVLYGDRSLLSGLNPGREITKLEALLMELLACGVASVLVRTRYQEAARAQRIRFEQFFSKQLAAQLEENPDLLLGKEAEVSILFCDIRGFSLITQELGAAKTVELINEALEIFSECIIDAEGVLVDYIGDEVMAMWGAPDEQPDHAERACRAALQMLSKIPDLNERWKPALKQTFSVGIGINTGHVQVGNTGSKRKFKYGPLGHDVNLASRVQGATKYLRSPLLVTGSTFERLGPAFHGRRLCAVRAVNMHDPVQLYELVEQPSEAWQTLRTLYEQALAEFEGCNFHRAASILSRAMSDFADDGPSLLLLSRAANAMVHGQDPQHPVWELSGK